MNKNNIVSENLDLLNEFMKLAFDNPRILDEIPSDSELIILPGTIQNYLEPISLLSG
jgi:hypothetical protein